MDAAAGGREMKIRGGVAVVTGASSGVGRAVAIALAQRGAAVALVARRRAELEQVASEIRSRGGRAEVLECDVSDSAAVARAAAEARQRLGPIDILVNSAGLGIWRPFAATSDADHRAMMAVNYWGTFQWIRALLPEMRERRRGAIVNVAAGSGKFALSITSGYSASKFAVAGLSESLRRELLGSGVTVGAVFPGSVKTAFWNDANIDRAELPPLVRFSPKLSPAAVARQVVWMVRLGLAERTLPLFVAFTARLNALWARLGDLLFWRWFLPTTLGLLGLRYLLGH
jgi:short-subunit dehydrogenase